MQYRLLGKTGVTISEIGFGCMSLHKTSDDTAIRIMQQAVDAGINFFDTSDLYDKGANEMLVGKALQPVRKKIILATKVGNVWRADGSGWDWNPSKTHIMQAVEKSLARLQTDYIDLYQLHGGTMEDPIDETIEAFELLKQQGKILHYGISSIRPNVIHEYMKRSNIVSVMMQYSLLDRRPEENLLDLLHTKGISVLVRGALAQGLLAGKPAKAYLDLTEKEVMLVQSALQQIQDKGSDAQQAIRYVLHHPAVASAVAGFSRELQLKEVLEAPDAHLSVQKIEALRKVIPPLQYTQHRVS